VKCIQGVVQAAVAVLVLAAPGAIAFQGAQGARKPATAKPAAAAADFDRVVKEAEAARQAQNWERAVDLYKQAVKLRPDYVEGYWYQGTSLYSLDEFEECRSAFRRVVRLAPKNGAAFAFLGLCEFGLKEYDRALQNLVKGRDLGIGDKDLGGVARYHAAIIMSRAEEYEQALGALGEFASEGNDNPRVIEAMGIATLRMPMLPIEVPPDRREMVLMAGRGSYLMATRMTAAAGTAFEALVTRYPDVPNVHYAYAVFLLIEQQDKAIEHFKRELELQPGHSPSLMHIAFEYLRRGDPASALPWARQAVEAAPTNFATHKALGDALVESGEVEAGIGHLETGVKMAPDSPGLRFSLAKAYQRAGRTADAARERQEFTRLDRLARTNKLGAQSVGGTSPAPEPVPQ
jgi:tetratricopeptide (TPR) repeat protein